MQPYDSSAENLISFAKIKAFAEPEKLLAAYFRSETVGLCILDTQFRYLAVNDALAKMNGIAPEEHIGKTIHDVWEICRFRWRPSYNESLPRENRS